MKITQLPVERSHWVVCGAQRRETGKNRSSTRARRSHTDGLLEDVNQSFVPLVIPRLIRSPGIGARPCAGYTVYGVVSKADVVPVLMEGVQSLGRGTSSK